MQNSNNNLPEITPRVIILSVILTVTLAAANAYLGLKLGGTVSASIPAAVISMGILRFFKNSNILENNMVQTTASVGEALTAGIAFILPALLIMGIWDGFHYWQTVLVSLLGGCLGVLYTVPLREALLKDNTLRYPEGTAIANVLKASSQTEAKDLRFLVSGGFVGSAIALFQSGFQILSGNFSFWIKTSTSVFGMGFGLSPALIAAGYIVGLNVAISMLVGITIGWLIGVPVLTHLYGFSDTESAGQIATTIWHSNVRYIGVGTMLIGGLWTLCTLARPVVTSISKSFTSLRRVKLGLEAAPQRTDQDIPMHYVLFGVCLLIIPIFWLISQHVIPQTEAISTPFRNFIACFSTFYIFIAGFVFCAIAAYFAGLIGSTNSPGSGLLVSALLILCLILMGFVGAAEINLGTIKVLESVAIGSVVVMASGLFIANDTMQDLKVGQIVGATPWKQQLMLLFGVIVSSFVIPLILQLLYQAYGIGGVFPRPGMNPDQMLAAPQAGLMAAVTQGAFSHQLKWGMIFIGGGVAIVSILIDEIVKRKFDTRFPVLAVGLGIYLPMDSSTPCVIGGFLAWLIQHRMSTLREEHVQSSRHRGTLLACGIVAGSSLMGVLLAIPFALWQSSDVLRIMPKSLMPLTGPLGVLVTVILCVWIYRTVLISSRQHVS